jgi:uncharacterized protein (TIGR02231 family)
MKPHCFLFAFVAFSLPVIVHASEPVVADSKITDVTVYADRAQVTRTAEVSLSAGETRVSFDSLPVDLFDDSVRASGKGAAPVSIQDVEVRRTVREQVADATAKELETRLQKLRDENAALDARQRVLDQQRNFLSQIQIKAAGDISRDVQINKLDVAQLKELPGFLGAEFGRLEEESQKLTVARRELDPKIRAAEAEFNKRRVAAARADKTAIVTVNAKEPTKLKLQVSYVLGRASWTPTYDARAAADAGTVEFTYNGTVRQQTGEDWRGVNVTLSTARPSVGARMPELSKWMVNFFEPVDREKSNYRAFGGAAAPPSALAATEDVFQKSINVSAEPVPTTPLQAQIEQGVTSASFRVPHAADVPSDGEPHRQTVSVLSLGASCSYVATPKLSSFAYLRATVTNTTDAPLLGGTVNVFVGSDFMGAGWIGMVPQMAKFDLFLGIDESVHVKREELKEKRGKSGIFNKRSRQVYGYKITVENYKDRPQTVTVYEPIPVSANDDIKVTLGDTSVKPTEVDAPKGKLTWDMALKPREKREIVYEFTVDWPQDRQISGL